MPRLQITPEEFKRAKIVKPGWYPTLIKDVVEELNSKKDGMNIVLDVENADNKTEFMGVPAKVWFTEKFPQSAVSFVKAVEPGISESAIADIEFGNHKGRFIYAKWSTNRGKDGTDPARNQIDDWAPLPKAWEHLNSNTATGAPAVAGFGG
jgi:hypothetical protein